MSPIRPATPNDDRSSIRVQQDLSITQRVVRINPGIIYVVVGVLLGTLLIVGSAQLYQIEGGMSEVASLLPLGYAFAAGMVATANPCGVLLLPSLVAYYLGQRSGAGSGWSRAGSALGLGGMATLGFIVIFALVGVVVGIGGHALGTAFPIGGLIVGIALAGLGVWIALTGHEVGILAAGGAMGRIGMGSGPGSLFAFGVAYAIASLACTLPIFLVVVGSALATSGVVTAALQFISYALGMGLVLTAVIVATAFFQSLVARWLRRIVPYVNRGSAAFLIGAGIYVVSYWINLGHALG